VIVAASADILDQLAKSIRGSDAPSEPPGIGACGPDGSWCAGDLAGASFNLLWRMFATWSQPLASDSQATVDEDASVAVSGPYKIGYVPPRSTTARHETFVTRRELEESGEIVGAFEDKLMLSTTDQTYARFKGGVEVKKGEAYVIYRTEREIVHPVTKEVFGYQTVVVGAGRVTAVEEKAVKLTITQTFEPIERGAYLGPWADKFVRQVSRRPNATSLNGTLLGASQEILTMIGEHHVVFIDKGKDDGVQEGNVFKVVRAGDPFKGPMAHAVWNDRLPKEDVGDLLVIDVKDHGSTALVTRSLVELYIGDRVELRAEGARPGGE